MSHHNHYRPKDRKLLNFCIENTKFLTLQIFCPSYMSHHNHYHPRDFSCTDTNEEKRLRPRGSMLCVFARARTRARARALACVACVRMAGAGTHLGGDMAVYESRAGLSCGSRFCSRSLRRRMRTRVLTYHRTCFLPHRTCSLALIECVPSLSCLDIEHVLSVYIIAQAMLGGARAAGA